MRDKFKGYTRKTDEEIKSIWDTGLITFDANVLLNLYRYSANTQKELLKIFLRFKNKIWLAHQASLEYHRNRYEVIAEQEKAYDSFNKRIEQIENELQSATQPPFLSDELHKQLRDLFAKVKNEVKENLSSFSKMLKNDYVYEKLNKYFQDKIGTEFDEETLTKLCEIGAKRFENKIPPGFEDKEKEGNRKYGDFILWEQIKYKAKEDNKAIILITDERKKDWWWKLDDGRKIGPRQELVQELWDFAGVDFLMYSSERFLTFASEYLNQKLNEQAFEEIKERKNLENQLRRKEVYLSKTRAELLEATKLKQNQSIPPEEYRSTLNLLQKRIENIEGSLGEFSIKEVLDSDDRERMENLTRMHRRYTNDRNYILEKIFMKEENYEKNIHKYFRKSINEDNE